MKKQVKLTALTLAAMISMSTSVFAMDIPKESLPADLRNDTKIVEVAQNLIGDILDEVANGMGGGDAQSKAEKVISAACDAGETNGYGYGDLIAIARNAISTVRDMYLRPELHATQEQKTKEIISDLIEDVEIGGNYDTALKTALERIPVYTISGDINADIKRQKAEKLLLEAREIYLAKQNTAGAAVTASEPISGGKSINVFVDGNAVVFDVQPVIINDRTMIPIRKLANAIGISDDNVMYDDVTRRAVFINGAQTVILTIDNAAAQVNGENVMLDSPATIVSDRTLVPLRFISETFGYTVDYNDDGTTLNVYLTK